jgi:hypothetical protein
VVRRSRIAFLFRLVRLKEQTTNAVRESAFLRKAIMFFQFLEERRWQTWSWCDVNPPLMGIYSPLMGTYVALYSPLRGIYFPLMGIYVARHRAK